jgi:hypothetical protein
MLQPIRVNFKGSDVDAICVHWKTFPIPSAIMAKAEDISVDDLYRKGTITPSEWQRAQFWVHNCGKYRMDSACGGCPHIRLIEERNHLIVLVTPDGKTAVPVVDSTTIEALTRYRQTAPTSFKQGA